MAWTWLTRLFQGRRGNPHRRPARSAAAKLRFRPGLLNLESRLTPAATILESFPGQFFTNTFDTTFALEPDYEIPADPSIAVGPTRTMQVVNSTIVIQDKD